MASGLIRVVTADRNKELREYIGHSLQFDGRFEIVAQTDSAPEAFQLAMARAADAIVIDYMSVDECTETIHRMKPMSPDLKVIALSEGTASIDQEALTAGADAVVDKGEGIETVVATLSNLCDTDYY